MTDGTFKCRRQMHMHPTSTLAKLPLLLIRPMLKRAIAKHTRYMNDVFIPNNEDASSSAG